MSGTAGSEVFSGKESPNEVGLLKVEAQRGYCYCRTEEEACDAATAYAMSGQVATIERTSVPLDLTETLVSV